MLIISSGFCFLVGLLWEVTPVYSPTFVLLQWSEYGGVDPTIVVLSKCTLCVLHQQWLQFTVLYTLCMYCAKKWSLLSICTMPWSDHSHWHRHTVWKWSHVHIVSVVTIYYLLFHSNKILSVNDRIPRTIKSPVGAVCIGAVDGQNWQLRCRYMCKDDTPGCLASVDTVNCMQLTGFKHLYRVEITSVMWLDPVLRTCVRKGTFCLPRRIVESLWTRSTSGRGWTSGVEG